MNGSRARFVFGFVATAALTVGGCAPAVPVLSLAIDDSAGVDAAFDVNAVPADGLGSVALVATLAPAEDAVIAFELDGVGLLSSTSSLADAGVARVELFAPFEDDLPTSAFTSTVTARVILDEVPQEATAAIGFIVPTTGAPVLRARTVPDRVTAGGTTPITVVLEGLRLPSATATLSADSDVIDVPATMELAPADDVPFRGEVVIQPPATPGDVVVTATIGDVTASVTLRFIAEGEPAFDLTGTFAQLTYGTVEVDDFFLLAQAPQCVVAPALSLVTVVQTGAHLEVDSVDCKIEMPGVDLVGLGMIVPTVPPAFVTAANAAPQEPMIFDLDDVSADAAFSPPASSMDPLIVGVNLENDTDALPTDGDDGRVVDADGDGRPGVTIFTGSDPQEMAYRTRVTSMTGVIESSDRVSGDIESVTESVIFNSSFGGIGPQITGQPSPFVMVRVDGRNGADNVASRDADASSISCEDIKAYASELALQAPAPNARTACQ